MKNAEDESDMDCSDDFTLIASEDAPEVGEMGYSLTVTSPSVGDTAMAGEEYTVEVRKLPIFSKNSWYQGKTCS